MTQVANGEIECEAHLAGHYDETHVPTEGPHDKQQSSASLRGTSSVIRCGVLNLEDFLPSGGDPPSHNHQPPLSSMHPTEPTTQR